MIINLTLGIASEPKEQSHVGSRNALTKATATLKSKAHNLTASQNRPVCRNQSQPVREVCPRNTAGWALTAVPVLP